MVIISPQLKEKELRKNKRKEFQDRLLWALNDLKSDAERYDSGEFSAINRSSVTLRTLFYNSNCILKQLGIARKIELPSFTPKFTEHDCINYGALVFTRLPRYSKTMKYFDTMLFNPNVRYHKMKFNRWLRQPILRYSYTDLSRENLIRFMANEDGGAHVDHKINKFFKNLRDGDSSFRIITTDINDETFKNIVGGFNNHKDIFPTYINWGLTRQIVHETLLAFDEKFNLNYNPDLERNFNKRLNKFIFNFNVSDPNLREETKK
ncbi:hypothetical protein Q3C15_07815 [Ligilactobacillus sp. 110_WCHN]|nr:hypothetical protein [Ligilactobacillus sp. 110_WCHN]